MTDPTPSTSETLEVAAVAEDAPLADTLADAPIAVRVGGKIVARGELVDVDGTPGVRTLERLV